MKYKLKQKLLNFLYSLIPLGELFLLCTLSIGYVLIFVVLFLSAKKLGVWFFPALVAYVIPIVGVKYWISKREDRNQLRALGGEKLFAELYPNEAEKAARKQKKTQEKAAEKAERKASKIAEDRNEKKSPKRKNIRDRDREYRGPEF